MDSHKEEEAGQNTVWKERAFTSIIGGKSKIQKWEIKWLIRAQSSLRGFLNSLWGYDAIVFQLELILQLDDHIVLIFSSRCPTSLKAHCLSMMLRNTQLLSYLILITVYVNMVSCRMR